jgi:aminoglycoside phosphotransferase (APT) family kinase protein
LVRRLVGTQFARWAELPLELRDPAGSDHVIHRLGHELCVRLPRQPGAVGQARKECEWLPRLAPHLPLLRCSRTRPKPLCGWRRS